MNRKDSINLAREAQEQVAKEMPPNTFDLDLFYERFAELVRADEREACAKFAEESLTRGRSPLGPYVADAIRARGETK